MDFLDTTEYTFAMEVFGSWKAWKKISSNKDILFFTPTIPKISLQY